MPRTLLVAIIAPLALLSLARAAPPEAPKKAPPVASAKAPPTAPDKAPPAAVVLNQSDEELIRAWIAARIESAGAGRREIVRIPLIHKCLGWGCVCPEWYIGESAGNAMGLDWLTIDDAPYAELPSPGESGLELVAEGWFTGAKDTFEWRSGDELVEDYTLQGFHVERWRRMGDSDKDRTLSVVADAAATKAWPEPLTDARPWVAIAHSVPRESKGAAEKAEKLRAALVEKGYAQAEILDSRQLPRLFCCFYSVVLGRYATEEEALAAVKAASKSKDRKSRVKAYVRRGF